VLQVLHDCSHPLVVTTKSALVLRDLDLIGPMAERHLARAGLSDHPGSVLARRLEPRAASPQRRIEAIRALAQSGIPVGCWSRP